MSPDNSSSSMKSPVVTCLPHKVEVINHSERFLHIWYWSFIFLPVLYFDSTIPCWKCIHLCVDSVWMSLNLELRYWINGLCRELCIGILATLSMCFYVYIDGINDVSQISLKQEILDESHFPLLLLVAVFFCWFPFPIFESVLLFLTAVPLIYL